MNVLHHERARLERDIAHFLAGGLPDTAEEFMRYAKQRIDALPGIAEAEGVSVQDGNTDCSQFYCWVRLCDSAAGCFDFDLSAQQGKRVSFGVVAGA